MPLEGRTWPALALAEVDDLVHAALVDFDVAAVEEIGERSCRVFFPTADARAAAALALKDQFPTLAISAVDVPDDDWAARSQASLKAVRVGNIVVAPPWDAGGDSSRSIEIIIQPSMGFGTGHHATTRLCLGALQQLDLHRKSVVDVGTGSGVLAIAASLLGANPVTGVDDDPDALQSAAGNVALNPDATVTLHGLDLRTAGLPPADVVLANLTGGLLIAAAARLQELAGAGGTLVLSGFMEHEEADVLRAYASWRPAHRSQEDEWVCVRLRRGYGEAGPERRIFP